LIPTLAEEGTSGRGIRWNGELLEQDGSLIANEDTIGGPFKHWFEYLKGKSYDHTPNQRISEIESVPGSIMKGIFPWQSTMHVADLSLKMGACDNVLAYCLGGEQKPVAAFWLRFPDQRDDLIRKVKASTDALIHWRPGGSVMHVGTNSVHDACHLQIHAYDVHQNWRTVIILEWRRAPGSNQNHREFEVPRSSNTS
jgi:hypothetical protein